MGDVIGIYGGAGAGKTTLATALLAKFPNMHIYSRMKFNLPHYHALTPLNVIELRKTEIEVTVVWDEGYEEMDNREFMSLKSRINSYILFQRRKRNLNFMGLAPLYMFDVRWRKSEKLAFFAKDRPQTDAKGKPSQADFKYIVTDWKHKPRKFTFPFKYAKKYFPLFDTMQMIQPQDMDDIKADLAAANPKELNRLINKYVETMIKRGNVPEKVKDITSPFVKNEMLTLGMPLRFAPFVYVRLRHKIQGRGELQ